MAKNNPFQAIKKWASVQKERGLQEPPKLENINSSPHKKGHSPAVEANTPRRRYRIWTMISEGSGADIEKIMIRIREETGKKPKQAEALEAAI
jgi:hypothetical protein